MVKMIKWVKAHGNTSSLGYWVNPQYVGDAELELHLDDGRIFTITAIIDFCPSAHPTQVYLRLNTLSDELKDALKDSLKPFIDRRDFAFISYDVFKRG